jgi:hypothetical protein
MLSRATVESTGGCQSASPNVIFFEVLFIISKTTVLLRSLWHVEWHVAYATITQLSNTILCYNFDQKIWKKMFIIYVTSFNFKVSCRML